MTDLDKMARELLCSHCDMSAEDYYEEMPVTAPEAESAIRTALLTAPPGYVMVPLELAGRLQASIGAFVSDEGWGAADMGTAYDLSALLAAAPEVK